MASFGVIKKKPSFLNNKFKTSSDIKWIQTTESERRKFKLDVMNIIKEQLAQNSKAKYEDLYQNIINLGFGERPDGRQMSKSRCDKYVVEAKLDLGIEINEQKSRATPTSREIIRLYKAGFDTAYISKAVGKEHRYCTAIRSYAVNRRLM